MWLFIVVCNNRLLCLEHSVFIFPPMYGAVISFTLLKANAHLFTLTSSKNGNQPNLLNSLTDSDVVVTHCKVLPHALQKLIFLGRSRNLAA